MDLSVFSKKGKQNPQAGTQDGHPKHPPGGHRSAAAKHPRRGRHTYHAKNNPTHFPCERAKLFFRSPSNPSRHVSLRILHPGVRAQNQRTIKKKKTRNKFCARSRQCNTEQDQHRPLFNCAKSLYREQAADTSAKRYIFVIGCPRPLLHDA